MLVWLSLATLAHGEQGCTRVWRRAFEPWGTDSLCGQASGHVLPSAVQREQPISLVRSRSASIAHRVAQARVVVVGDSPAPATRSAGDTRGDPASPRLNIAQSIITKH